MNKFLKLTLSFLFLFGLIQDNIIFAAGKTENISSSSTSSSSSSSVAPICVSHGEIMNALSGRQKKAAQEISKLEQFKHFPPGLIPLVMQYEDYNEDATKDLLDIQNNSLDPKTKIKRIKEALKNGANPNNAFDSYQYFDSPLEYALVREAMMNFNAEDPLNYNYEIVKTLLDAGANINTRSFMPSQYVGQKRNTASPLWQIISNIILTSPAPDMNYEIFKKQNAEILKLLLERGADLLAIKDGFNCTFEDLIKLDEEGILKKTYEEYLQEKAKKETSSSSSSSTIGQASTDNSSSSSQIPNAHITEPFNYPGSPASAPKDDKVKLTIPQLRFLWDNVTPEQRKAWENAGGPDVDPRIIKEIGKATVRIILG